MLSKFPTWKYILLVVVSVVAFVYAIPNIYPDSPAVQVSGAKASVEVGHAELDRAKAALEKAGIHYDSGAVVGRSVLILFADSEAQLEAREVVQEALGSRFVVALSLAPTTPGWLEALGAKPMKLGLDLRGGVHFLMEVDMASAVKKRLEIYRDEVRDKLREEKIGYGRVREKHEDIQVSFRSAVDQEKALPVLRKFFPQFDTSLDDAGGATDISMTMTRQALKDIEDYAVSQNLTTIRNRVNELGVAEPVVQRQGVNRIVVELPGVQDTAAAKRVIGRTANLEFRLVDVQTTYRGSGTKLPANSEIIEFKDGRQQPVVVQKRVIVTGDRVVDAQSNYDENGRPQVNIKLDGRGGRMMNKVTRDHIKDPMAVVFIESRPETITTIEHGKTVKKVNMVETREVINQATIQSALGQNFRITGLDSPVESSELALLLRAGALAAPMYYVEERTVGPSLGQQNIEDGLKSLLVGFVIVLLFMVAYYRVFGLIADMALTMNLVLLVACMSLIPGAALSLPGMAGIVLTVGMAVDANVLIFARIREELRNGLSPAAAISSGYDRAFVTILDANITTLLVAVVLFVFGSGPVKGFAVTLSIGILSSMFTAITGTRALVTLVYGGKQLKSLKI